MTLPAASPTDTAAAIDGILNDPNDWAARFLEAWPKNYFSVGRTCDAIGIARRSFKHRRTNDPAFDALVEEAMEQFRETVRAELTRRALEPSERPVYHKGELVDTILEYDNRHLEWLAERLMPEEFHLPLVVQFVGGDEADFTFRMGEEDHTLELPPGDVQESDPALDQPTP